MNKKKQLLLVAISSCVVSSYIGAAGTPGSPERARPSRSYYLGTRGAADSSYDWRRDKGSTDRSRVWRQDRDARGKARRAFRSYDRRRPRRGGAGRGSWRAHRPTEFAVPAVPEQDSSRTPEHYAQYQRERKATALAATLIRPPAPKRVDPSDSTNPLATLAIDDESGGENVGE